jgi:5-hydroxyisourate hydrolase-like protein (transthyretin family)
MIVLEYEVAALYYYVADILGIKSYFDRVPENMIIPCVFYPAPTLDPDSFSTSAFSTVFTMYVKVMDISNLSAAGKASKVIQAICKNRYKVPLVDENGKKTGKNFRIESLKSEKVDEGVYQLTFTWKRYTKYTENAAQLAREFFFNGIPIGTD